MVAHGIPALFTVLFLWWFGTGAILYLDGLDRRTHRRTLLLASLCAALALFIIARTSGELTTGSAYHGFIAALVVWGWQEIAFLLGYVTGPQSKACPPGLAAPRRARLALGAILWHELFLLGGMVVLFWLCWGQPNLIAFETYLLLWTMRSSTKLNLFLGARNLYAEFLPSHLKFLATFFRQRSMNLLFPVSVTLATAASMVLIQRAVDAGTGHDAVAASLLATLCILGLLEHWFLMLPLPVAHLWRWGLSSHRGGSSPKPVTPVPGIQEAT